MCLADRTVAILLAVVAVAVRVPFRAQFLVNWDAVNFALGIGGFDLVAHQPHPPGYLGWVVLSRAATWVTSDPNAAMTLLSAISGAVATALLYLLARRFADRRTSGVAALLFTTAPLVWYYSEVALSYMTTGAVAVALLLALLVALDRGSERHLLAASLLLAFIGALRPTDQLMLAPAWAIVVLTFGWRSRLRAAAVVSVASLAWLVPLLRLSGGWAAFREQSSAVADLAGTRTWILSGNLAGIGQNVGMVTGGLVLGLFGGLAVLVAARAHGIRPFGGMPSGQRRLLLAWVLPPLAVYLLVHTGQLGYVILLLPVGYVGVARALPPLAVTWRDRWRATRTNLHRVRRPAAAVAALLAINTVTFLVLPGLGLRMIEVTAAAASAPRDTAAHQPLSLDRSRQYDVAANDQHWRELVALIDHFDPRTTMLVAETSSAGSFRHLSYYAPDHHVFGYGWDRRGDLGFLFAARHRNTTYSVERLTSSDPVLLLPPEIRVIVVPDQGLVSRWRPPVSVDEVQLADGSHVGIVRLAGPAAIVVDNPPSRETGLVDGFPTAADRDGAKLGREAEIRVVPAARILDPSRIPTGLVP